MLSVMAMSHNIRASLLFFVGLGIAILALHGLSALDREFSGLGDGSGGGSNTTGSFNEVFAVLICSYFLVSAIGVFIAKSRAALLSVASISHSFVVASYLMVFFQGRGGSTFASGMALIAGAYFIFFLPWLAVWSHVIRKAQ